MSKMFANLMDRTQQPIPNSGPSENKGATRPASAPDRQREQSDARTIERPAENTNGHAIKSTAERAKVRHSFDVYRDQLLALGDIQQSMARQQGKRPRLGDLVQEALDSYIQDRS